MRTVLFGLGHVGATMAGCLAEAGHAVHGVDPDPAVVAAVMAGRAPVREPGLDALVHRGTAAGRLTAATTAAGDVLEHADLAAVCVATPAGPDGRLELAAVRAVALELAAAVRQRPTVAPPLLLLFRSTLPPGTTEGVLLPLLADVVGEGPGSRYEVAHNPEFLRQGSAVGDFRAPARIVLGERWPGATRRLRGLYDGLAAPLLEVPFQVAELAKLLDNGWHALKVAFANEVGRAAAGAGIDPEAVMAVLRADAARNLGPAYLWSGGPYGGSCLAKDLAALLAHADAMGVTLPVLEGVASSNELHARWLTDRVRLASPPPGPVLQVGLSFKAGTDDLRGSPLLELAQALTASGYALALHDPDLPPARLHAACRTLGAAAQPSLAAALTAAADARLVLFGKPAPELAARLPAGTETLELSGLRGFSRRR